MIDTRHEFDDLLRLYLPIALAVVAIVFATVLFCVVRFRRREGREPSRRHSLPVVEGVYALTLAAIAALLITVTFRTEARVDSVRGRPGLVVRVTAFQWGWRFDYPQRGVSLLGNDRSPPTLAVPTGTTVRFQLTSRDVIHSFWIPAERFKRDAFPHRTTRFDLVFDSAGSNAGRCAEFCGLHHADMTFDVLSLSPRRFDQWLAERR